MTREDMKGRHDGRPFIPCKETGRDASTNLPLPSSSCPASLARTSPQTDQAEKRRGGNLGGEPPLRLGGSGALQVRLSRSANLPLLTVRPVRAEHKRRAANGFVKPLSKRFRAIWPPPMIPFLPAICFCRDREGFALIRVAIRVVQADEWERARDLRLRALADAPQAFGRSLAEENDLSESDWRERVTPSDERAWFVETADDQFIGMATGFFDERSETAYLFGMWVEPECRRSGIGKRLVERVIAWGRERGAARIELEVNEATRPAVALYEACGFAPTGRSRPLPSNPSATAVEMARSI
jgi:ribosomal protein S18 acetylase RimI-like enzyme